MALADLLDALARDAELEIAGELASAQAEAAAIREAAARSREVRVATARRASEAAQREAIEARVAEVRRRTRTEVLGARLAMLERLRAAVAGQLPGEVSRVADVLAVAAGAAAAGAAGSARCHPSLTARLREVAPQLEVTTEATLTGAVVELAHGTRIEATLGALLEREWSRLAPEALALVEEAA